MKKITFLLIIFNFLCPFRVLAETDGTSKSVKAKQLNSFLYERDAAYYTYNTKFGPLVFLRSDKTPGSPAKYITLGDKNLISLGEERDATGAPIYYLIDDQSISVEDFDKKASKPLKSTTRRLVVSLGADLRCAKKFIILDFTGMKPFISQRFGYNPDDRYCLKFKKAKWGKKESYVTLADENKYIYYTFGAAFGPIE